MEKQSMSFLVSFQFQVMWHGPQTDKSIKEEVTETKPVGTLSQSMDNIFTDALKLGLICLPYMS